MFITNIVRFVQLKYLYKTRFLCDEYLPIIHLFKNDNHFEVLQHFPIHKMTES